jgi:hypothetical protein
MGAAFVGFTIRHISGVPLTKEEVKKSFDEKQEVCRHENGHRYSGGIGMADGIKFVCRTFPADDEAYDWLEEHLEKWGPAQAVKLSNGDWVVGALCSE